MRAAPVSEPAIDARVLGAWLRQARTGDVFEYHRGQLALDRAGFGAVMSETVRRALDDVASFALRLFAQGRVHLVQRRLPSGSFSYLAIARPLTQSGRPSRGPKHLLEAGR